MKKFYIVGTATVRATIHSDHRTHAEAAFKDFFLRGQRQTKDWLAYAPVQSSSIKIHDTVTIPKGPVKEKEGKA